jgi:NAD(P)-dependent dehydrogenase (short-subunit alcohol dehydrogenase family)
MRLKNKVAIVTGGAQGLGLAIAEALIQEGARVVICDVAHAKLKDAEERLAKSGCALRSIDCDVTDPRSVDQMVGKCIQEFGCIDILINNAGGSGGDSAYTFLEPGYSRDIWGPVLKLNLEGTINCSMSVIPHMIEKKSGRIINVSSQSAKYASEMSGPVYAASKAGQLGLTRNLAVKLGVHGINVNAVVAGVVISGPRMEGKWKALTEQEREEKLASVPLRRLGTPQDIAQAVVFLASNDSSYINGASLDVNGGRFMS